MCGRTACTLAPDEIKRACKYQNHGKWKEPDWKDGDQDKYKPSYNKSPQTNNPVLVSLRHFQKDADSSERVLTAMRWGLIPSWFPESDPSKMQYSTSNCRSDGMMQKKSYKDPLLKGQRCVVLADGFYEWQRQQGAKQPYFIYFPQYKQEESEDKDDSDNWKGWRLLTMAGIFDCWKPADGGDLLYSYTVITVNASKAMDWVHDRMPAILDGAEAVRRWLDFGEVSTNEAVKLIHSIEAICLHPVSTIVNSTRNNSPECVKPLEIGIKESTASSKMMMNWLKSESPKKKPNNPELSQMPVKDESPKKTSAGLMQLWLKKSEEPAEKKAKFS